MQLGLPGAMFLLKKNSSSKVCFAKSGRTFMPLRVNYFNGCVAVHSALPMGFPRGWIFDQSLQQSRNTSHIEPLLLEPFPRYRLVPG